MIPTPVSLYISINKLVYNSSVYAKVIEVLRFLIPKYDSTTCQAVFLPDIWQCAVC